MCRVREMSYPNHFEARRGPCAPDTAVVIEGPTWGFLSRRHLHCAPTASLIHLATRLCNAGSRGRLRSYESVRCTWTRCFDGIREVLGWIIGEMN